MINLEVTSILGVGAKGIYSLPLVPRFSSKIQGADLPGANLLRQNALMIMQPGTIRGVLKLAFQCGPKVLWKLVSLLIENQWLENKTSFCGHGCKMKFLGMDGLVSGRVNSMKP